MKDIIITTTSFIENKPIQEYLGLVCSSLVIGTNLFSDMSASLSDIFGGKSSSYERKLEIIREEAISDLKNKTIVVSEHRLYYLRGLADRFIYMKGGKITREYTAEEFNGLSEQARTEIGLRTFALEQ